MRFRNSTRLLIENFKNVYKILLYKLAIAVVAIALSCALLLPNLWDIVHSAEVTNLIDIVKDFFRALVTGDSQFLAGFQEQFKTMGTALLKLLDSRMSKIVWSVVGCGVVYLLERFLDTLCYFSIGSILNDRMATLCGNAVCRRVYQKSRQGEHLQHRIRPRGIFIRRDDDRALLFSLFLSPGVQRPRLSVLLHDVHRALSGAETDDHVHVAARDGGG